MMYKHGLGETKTHVVACLNNLAQKNQYSVRHQTLCNDGQGRPMAKGSHGSDTDERHMWAIHPPYGLRKPTTNISTRNRVVANPASPHPCSEGAVVEAVGLDRVRPPDTWGKGTDTRAPGTPHRIICFLCVVILWSAFVFCVSFQRL